MLNEICVRAESIDTMFRPWERNSNKMSEIDIPGHGTLWVANKPRVPLLIVFGGITLMLSQMDGIKRFSDGRGDLSAQSEACIVFVGDHEASRDRRDRVAG